MSAVAYSKKRMLSQAVVGGFTSKKIELGTVCTIIDLVEDFFVDNKKVKQPNDKILLLTDKGVKLKLSVREYNKMTTVDGASNYNSEGDSDEITLPSQFKVVKSENRMANDEKEPRYPTYAYTDAQKFIDSKGEMKYEELIASGLKKDNKFDPLQNYTIEII